MYMIFDTTALYCQGAMAETTCSYWRVMRTCDRMREWCSCLV